MEICTIEKLINTNFNILFMNALVQFWRTTKAFQCIGAPKKQNLLLFLDGCQITCTNKDGYTYTAQNGDVIYIPTGSEYKALLSNFRTPDSHTVGINFFLLDETSQQLILSKDITVFHLQDDCEIPLLFQKITQQDVDLPLQHSRLLLFQILCRLASCNTKTNPPGIIAPALTYLSAHLEESPSVVQLANLCNISEVYFRKQFKKATGSTPSEYRNMLRLKKARPYLEYGDISIQEISAALGYATVSHFIQAFKKQYGCSPLQYRKGIRNNQHPDF